jgi:hypothetical protein
MVDSRATMGKTKISEWLWRFLAVVMMFSVGWTIWIIYQLNPPPLIMNAAFEAAAKAKGKGMPAEKQSAQGVIAPQSGTDVASTSAEAQAGAPKVPEGPKEPLINPEKLKFSETIAIPVPPAKK